MKFITVIVASLLALNVFAQSQTENELVNTFLKAEKKALVAENMELSDDDAAVFWEIYNEYTVEREALRKDRSEILDDYLSEFLTLSDETTEEVMNATLASRKSENKLVQKYHKKFKKALGVKVATRFYMVEEQIQLILRVSMWEQLPMVDTHVEKISENVN